MRCVFVNYPFETFTPTQSGALATILHECSRVAIRDGSNPMVITAGSASEPYRDVPTRLVDMPLQPTSRVNLFLRRAERRLFGYRHMGYRRYASDVIKVIREMDLTDVPIVFVNDPEMAVLTRRAFPKARILHWFQNQHGCKPRFRRMFSEAVDGVAAVSDYTAKWIENHYDLRSGSVKTVHNGVNLEIFKPSPNPVPGKPIINFVGRTGIEKAPDLLLRACLELSKTTSGFRVQLIGSNHWDRFEMDSYQRELKALSTQLEQKGIEVRCPGHVSRDALPTELQRAAIHVTPSRWEEPFGMTTSEAMACGVAVVASRTGGTPEVVGEAGLLFERDDVDGLAMQLWRLLTDEQLRHELGERGRARMAEFTWDRTWAGLSSLFSN